MVSFSALVFGLSIVFKAISISAFSSLNFRNQIFEEVDPLGFDLFNVNLSFSEKDQVQKIGFSPLKLISNWYTDWGISNLRINAANSSTGLTSGFSLGYDGSALESARVRGLYTKLKTKLDDDKLLPVLRPRGGRIDNRLYHLLPERLPGKTR